MSNLHPPSAEDPGAQPGARPPGGPPWAAPGGVPRPNVPVPPTGPIGGMYGSPGGYGPPPRAPRKKQRMITPGVAVILIGVVALIGGLVWFGINKNASDSSKDDAAGAPVAGLESGAGSTTLATIASPTTTKVPVTGSKAEFCPLEAQFHQAIALYDQAVTAHDSAGAARFAAPAAPMFDQLMKAAPNADLYGQMHEFWYHSDNMSKPSVDDHPGPGVLSTEEIGRHYRAGLGPVAGSPTVNKVQAYFDGCA